MAQRPCDKTVDFVSRYDANIWVSLLTNEADKANKANEEIKQIKQMKQLPPG
jgi:hypothetical protein